MNLTDAEIAGYMGWRGPGAYTEHKMRKIKEIVREAEKRERERCKNLCEADMNLALRTGQQSVAFGMKLCIDAITAANV